MIFNIVIVVDTGLLHMRTRTGRASGQLLRETSWSVERLGRVSVSIRSGNMYHEPGGYRVGLLAGSVIRCSPRLFLFRQKDHWF